jgi:hypothetical protein
VKPRAVRVGPGVDFLGTDVGESSEVLVGGHVPRALEHQVLAEVCQPRALRRVVLGPDVTPEVDGNERNRVVFRKNHFEAVAEAIALALHRQMRGHRIVERVGRTGGRTAGGGKRGNAQKRAYTSPETPRDHGPQRNALALGSGRGPHRWMPL